MKHMKRVFAILLAVLLLMAALATGALAERSRYTYTIRFYAGAQGVFTDGQSCHEYTARYGDRVIFSASDVERYNPEKYYVRGIRESGQDNSTVGYTSFVVTQDQDYVVAYGILNQAVAYTVNFVDTDGNELAESITGYANAGDKPVVSYQPIDGYVPNFYNLTKTLSDNAAENVFDFIYTAVAEPETPEEQTPAAPAEAAPAEEAAPEDAPAGEAPAEEIPAEDADADAADDDATQTRVVTTEDDDAVLLDENGETIPEPEEIGDLDVPLANAPGGSGTEAGDEAEAETGGSGALIAVIAAAVVAAAAAAYWFFVVRRRKKDADGSDEPASEDEDK